MKPLFLLVLLCLTGCCADRFSHSAPSELEPRPQRFESDGWSATTRRNADGDHR